jgi:hypothetical protein
MYLVNGTGSWGVAGDPDTLEQVLRHIQIAARLQTCEIETLVYLYES